MEAKRYRERFEQLKEERRQVLDTKCRQVSEYICPTLGRFDGDDRRPDHAHDVRGDAIIDSTAQDAHETAQNGMHSGLTPPSRPWFALQFQDDELMKWGPSRDWLDVLSQRVYSVLRRSNFYSSIHALYGEILAFANACLFMDRDFKSGIRFRPFTFGEWWAATDSSGRIDTLYRSLFMTARQIVERWGTDRISPDIATASDKFPYSSFEIAHCVQPRDSYDPKKRDKLNKPWESVYFEPSARSDSALSVGGMDAFPYVIGRWMTVSNDAYGTNSPAIRKLPDVKQLQDMETSIILAIHKELDPPVMAPSGMQGTTIRKGPGGITWYDSTSPPEGLRPLYETSFNVAATEAKSQQIRTRILHGFYNDLFLMINAFSEQRGNITATQIMEMQSEKLLQLGPFIERLEDEVLDPIIEFAVAVVLGDHERYGIEPPPAEIIEQDYKIEYVSLLAQAQKEIGKRAIDDQVAFIGNLITVFPEARHSLNVYDTISARHESTGAPASMIASQDEFKERVDAEKQTIAQQQQMQAATQMVQGAKTASDIKLNPDDPNAITALLGVAGQNGEGAI